MYKIIGADQKEYGPITADQLRQWISEGRVNAATRVLVDGETVWKTAGELPEFASHFSTTPPPPAAISRAPSIAMPAPAVQRTNQMALWSMITGIFSVLCCCFAWLGPLPIVLGVVAQSQIKKDPRQAGNGFAIAGIVLGIIAVLMAIAGSVSYMLSPQQPMPPNWQDWFKH